MSAALENDVNERKVQQISERRREIMRPTHKENQKSPQRQIGGLNSFFSKLILIEKF